jgi:hypothetical protein
MDTLTLTFYRAMLWATQLELAIAVSTGRNPEQIRALREDVARMSRVIDLLEVQRV